MADPDLRRDIDRNFADIPVCLCSPGLGAPRQRGVQRVVGVRGNADGQHGIPGIRRGAPTGRGVGAVVAGAVLRRRLRTRRARLPPDAARGGAGPPAKGTPMASFLAQALLVWAAAALAKASLDPRAFAVIALLAFQFGGQIVASRQLGFNEVPANVYRDLFSDLHILTPWHGNPKRNRRALAAVLMVLGAIAGGWLGRSDAVLSTALWIADGVKFLTAVAWLAWGVKKVPGGEK
ncbi:hypothetical protein DL769_006055 [Monosporascus sp. CRB-8-3]|nr:hypothetical protein DL769_006055 [Monosporascus sp. CRB-8-3]